MTNVYERLVMSNSALQEWAESTYGSDVYSQIAYYEISSDVKNSQNAVIYKKGQKVDLKFYNSNHDYNNGDISNTTITVSGQNISAPVTVWEDELRKNEAKREIYILKQPYIEPLLSELRKQSTYKKRDLLELTRCFKVTDAPATPELREKPVPKLKSTLK